ncbi:Protein of unknown function [Gryllus bimaculatus]|nr:Protein of unknown function [Gryllus bimaculatus]
MGSQFIMQQHPLQLPKGIRVLYYQKQLKLMFMLLQQMFSHKI